MYRKNTGTSFFKYAITTATKLDMLLVVEIDGSTAMICLYWAGSVPRFSKHLRTWGEEGTVTTKMDSTPKPKNRGFHCMMVRYADGHAGDCYQMWNPDTDKVYERRDVVFLQRFFERPDGPFIASLELYRNWKELRHP